MLGKHPTFGMSWLEMSTNCSIDSALGGRLTLNLLVETQGLADCKVGSHLRRTRLALLPKPGKLYVIEKWLKTGIEPKTSTNRLFICYDSSLQLLPSSIF